MRLAAGVVLLLLGAVGWSWGQMSRDIGYSRTYAFGGMVEYSNDSSHIELGTADNQKVGAIGLQYERRVVRWRWVDLGYSAELRPAMLVSGPTAITSYPSPGQTPEGVAKCVSGTTNQGEEVVTTTCGRQMTYTEGLSPFGFRVHFEPRRRLQFVFSNYEGYMFSARPIPTPQAGALNFTFEFGAGFEWYLSHRRSVRLEYALQHFSNKSSADDNPGVDSGLIKLTYSFGK